MGLKAKKKTVMKNLKKATAQFSTAKDGTLDFLPLEGGPSRDLPKAEIRERKATVLYIGRIPHGFYEDEMESFFSQFGKIKRLRIARNRKTGKSKHYGFIEFESPEAVQFYLEKEYYNVAKVVEECMHNYLMYEHLLQVHLVPPERVHPKLWKAQRLAQLVDWVQIERSRHDKERSLQQQQKMVTRVMRRDKKRRNMISEAGIDYECPEMVGVIQAAPKKIKFDAE